MSIARTMPHTENGITVNFPDTNYFQYEGCPAYITIKGQGVCEMDFVWWQRADNTLWMIELKGFYDRTNPLHEPPDLSNDAKIEKILKNLYDKSVHTLCMVENNRVNTASCHGFPITMHTRYKIIHLVSVHPSHELYLQPLSDKLKLRLATFRALYNVSSVAIVSYQRAVSGAIPLPFI